jgi:flavodoxin
MQALSHTPNILIIYDSAYGNTGMIARTVAAELAKSANALAVAVQDTWLENLDAVDLLIIGSPTQGGRPTRDIQDFIDQLSDDSLESKYVAAFDTRFAIKEHGFGMHMLMRTIGFAARKIAAGLRSKGGMLLSAPEGFVVTDKEGPLKKGELAHAVTWAKELYVKLPVKLSHA